MTPELFTKLMIAAVTTSLAVAPPRIPAGGEMLWRIFSGLCRTRSGSGHGPNPLTYAEIEAYARLYRWPLETRHVDVILAMDCAFLDQAYAQRGKGDGAGERALGGKNMTLDPATFDAVFG